MTAPMDDEDLLLLLSQALADKPPDLAIEAAYAAYGWRTLEADLAQLIEDTQVEVVGFEQTGTYSRLVSYQTDGGTIEVAIGDRGIEVSASPVPTKVVLLGPDSAEVLTLDDAGRARADGLAGSLRFEITWPDGAALTPWLTV